MINLKKKTEKLRQFSMIYGISKIINSEVVKTKK